MNLLSPPVIEVQDLEFSYEKTPILLNVSLTIAEREFIGIFGPNGGGKTTFLKLLLGFLKPSKGQITLLGTSPKAACKQVGYVPQAMRFDRQFPLSVMELVLMGSLSKAYWWGGFPQKVKEKAKEVLTKVNLLDKADQAFGTLSGGQAQRALIARALMNDPKLLLLDEPTANVDPEAENDIYHLLTELKGTMTILMVTHDLQAIVHRASRLLCVHRQITSLLPSAVCEHFALGLYHSPLIQPPTRNLSRY